MTLGQCTLAWGGIAEPSSLQSIWEALRAQLLSQQELADEVEDEAEGGGRDVAAASKSCLAVSPVLGT